MPIISVEHRCPCCNGRFRVSYDKSKVSKGLETVAKISAAYTYGPAGYLVVNELIKGQHILLRKMTGKGMYRFLCPHCRYESHVIY